MLRQFSSSTKCEISAAQASSDYISLFLTARRYWNKCQRKMNDETFPSYRGGQREHLHFHGTWASKSNSINQTLQKWRSQWAGDADADPDNKNATVLTHIFSLFHIKLHSTSLGPRVGAACMSTCVHESVLHGRDRHHDSALSFGFLRMVP